MSKHIMPIKMQSVDKQRLNWDNKILELIYDNIC